MPQPLSDCLLLLPHLDFTTVTTPHAMTAARNASSARFAAIAVRTDQQQTEVDAGRDRTGTNSGTECDALDRAVRRGLVDALVHDLRACLRTGKDAWSA